MKLLTKRYVNGSLGTKGAIDNGQSRDTDNIDTEQRQATQKDNTET